MKLDEPFASLFTQGMVIKDGAAMSKSRGNVVDPDELVARYGADTVRLFCLFQAPPERDLDWSDAGVEGSSRFLNRVWRLVQALLPRLAPPGAPLPQPLSEADRELHRLTHHTIVRVHEDLATRFHFNTAISAIMEHTTGLAGAEQASAPALREAVDVLLLLLAPLVPHFAAELWEATGHGTALDVTPWPTADPKALVRDLIELPVQVNGKLRGRITVSADAPEGDVVAAALADAQVQSHLGGRPVKRHVVVPGRLVSLVI